MATYSVAYGDVHQSEPTASGQGVDCRFRIDYQSATVGANSLRSLTQISTAWLRPEVIKYISINNGGPSLPYTRSVLVNL